jgi:hypothetical protein
VWNISKPSLKRVRLFANILVTIYIPISYAAKLAVLLEISRLLSNLHKRFARWGVWALGTCIALCYLATFFYYIFACSAEQRKKESTKSNGICTQQKSTIMVIGALNLISDATIFLFGLFALSRLQLSLSRKLRFAAVSCIGVTACLAASVELYHAVHLGTSMDFSRTIFNTSMFVYVLKPIR